jgi:hypothetical protein
MPSVVQQATFGIQIDQSAPSKDIQIIPIPDDLDMHMPSSLRISRVSERFQERHESMASRRNGCIAHRFVGIEGLMKLSVLDVCRDEGSPSSLVVVGHPKEGLLSLKGATTFQKQENEMDIDAIDLSAEAEAKNPLVNLRCEARILAFPARMQRSEEVGNGREEEDAAMELLRARKERAVGKIDDHSRRTGTEKKGKSERLWSREEDTGFSRSLRL